MPLLGGTRIPRARAIAAIAAFVVPPLAWLISLALSYVLQDFTCTAAASAAAVPPEDMLRIALLILNGGLLIVTVVSGVLSVVLARRDDDERNTVMFLAWTGAASAALFGFGIVLIGIHPLMFGMCG